MAVQSQFSVGRGKTPQENLQDSIAHEEAGSQLGTGGESSGSSNPALTGLRAKLASKGIPDSTQVEQATPEAPAGAPTEALAPPTEGAPAGVPAEALGAPEGALGQPQADSSAGFTEFAGAERAADDSYNLSVEPEENNPSAAWRNRQGAKQDASREEFARRAHDEQQQARVQEADNILSDKASSGDQRSFALAEKTAVARENRAAFDEEIQSKAKLTNVDPLTAANQSTTQDMVLKGIERKAARGEMLDETINASQVASALTAARSSVFEGLAAPIPTAVMANAKGTGTEYTSKMDYFEKISGVKDAALHSNTATLALAEVAISSIEYGRAQTGTEAAADPAAEESLDSLDELDTYEEYQAPDATQGRGAAYDPDDNPVKDYVDYADGVSSIGAAAIKSANRQGWTYDAAPEEVGQELIDLAVENGWAKIVKLKREKGEAEAIPRILFDPSFAFDLAPASEILLPPILKPASSTPAIQQGHESSLGIYYKNKKGAKQKKGTQLYAKSATEASINLSRVGHKAYGAEMAFLDAVMYRAQGEGEMIVPNPQLKDATMLNPGIPTDPTAVRARKTLKLVAKPQLDKKGREALAQNVKKINNSRDLMRGEQGKTQYPRHDLGLNTMRKYTSTRNANVTMHKEQRHVYRSSNPTSITASVAGGFKIPKSDNALLDMIDGGNVAQQAEANFLYTLGATLNPTSSDPRVLMQNALNNMETHAADGKILAEHFIGGNNLNEIIANRSTKLDPIDPATTPPAVMAIVDKLINNSDDGDIGYLFTAKVDAFLYSEARKPANASPTGGRISFPALAIGQLDMTAAGLAFMAKDSGSSRLLQSMGMTVDIDVNTGDSVENYEGPRDIYMNYTKTAVENMFNKPGVDKDLGDTVKSLFDQQLNSDNKQEAEDFIKTWGKPPMMITPFGKHPATHQSTVQTFLGKNPDFRDQLVEAYGGGDKAMFNIIEDLAGIHKESLGKLFDNKAMRAIEAINDVHAMGGVSFSMEGPGGNLQVFGVDKKQHVAEGNYTANGIELPIFSGESKYDPVGRAVSKLMKEVLPDGTTREFLFTPKMMSAGKNTPLAAWGQSRESILLDDVVNTVSDGKAVPPFMANMYDSLSFDSGSALQVWKGLNVDSIKVATEWDTVETASQAGIEQSSKTHAHLSSLKEVDMSYPNGEHAALGLKMDESFLHTVTGLAKIDQVLEVNSWMSPKFRAEEKARLQANMDLLNKIARLTNWTVPTVVDMPGQDPSKIERGGNRLQLETDKRSMQTIDGKTAAQLFNAWKKISQFNDTIKKWKDGEQVVKKRNETNKILAQQEGKIKSFSKPISYQGK